MNENMNENIKKYKIKQIIISILLITVFYVGYKYYNTPENHPQDLITPEVGIKQYSKDDILKFADTLDIEKHDSLNKDSHTVSRHVGKTEEWLLNKVSKSIETGRSFIAVTSFKDLKDANKYISNTIRDNVDDIVQWINDQSITHPKSFESKFDENVGYGFDKHATKLENLRYVRVVLVKLDDGTIKILTSYPKAE